jgi:hypothetical protein
MDSKEVTEKIVEEISEEFDEEVFDGLTSSDES